VYDCGAAVLRAAERAGEIETQPHEIRHQIFIESKEARESDAMSESKVVQGEARDPNTGKPPGAGVKVRRSG
jgi:hypothetical protein